MIDMDLASVTSAPRRWLIGAAIFLAWGAGCFTAGYLYHAHKTQVVEAKTEAKQEAIQAPVVAASDAIDQSAIGRRDSAIESTKTRTVYVTKLIKEASNENPAPVDCRLPDRLRDEINRDLSTDQPETIGAVRK